jgi:effector-binding domain-containing protein
MNIKLAKIKHPIVLATTTHANNYPLPATIYSMVNELKEQIRAQGALSLDSPMMNVNPDENGGYLIMVALPINKIIKPGSNTVVNKLVLNGNLLEVEVTGGKNNVTNAFTQIKNYQKDHRLISPAMPYELLITNRLAQKDTAKWVTKVYWPIF